MTPPAEGQEKDVLLVLDKQQGKVSAVKSFDKDGNLQTVSPTHGGEFMQVDKNSDVFSNFISNFFRKFQDTSGLELFSVKASEAEQDAKAIEENPPVSDKSSLYMSLLSSAMCLESFLFNVFSACLDALLSPVNTNKSKSSEKRSISP